MTNSDTLCGTPFIRHLVFALFKRHHVQSLIQCVLGSLQVCSGSQRRRLCGRPFPYRKYSIASYPIASGSSVAQTSHGVGYDQATSEQMRPESSSTDPPVCSQCGHARWPAYRSKTGRMICKDCTSRGWAPECVECREKTWNGYNILGDWSKGFVNHVPPQPIFFIFALSFC